MRDTPYVRDSRGRGSFISTMTQPRGHDLSEGCTLTTSTQTFPAQRGRTAGTEYHDHAWREVDQTGKPLLLGSYRCDLCHVVWEL